MEKRGNQDHRQLTDRSLDIWGCVINVDKRTGVNRSGEPAAAAGIDIIKILLNPEPL
jgi:hypothetical protein